MGKRIPESMVPMKRFFVGWLAPCIPLLCVALTQPASAQSAVQHFVGFGQTVQQCDAAYGKAYVVTSAKVLVCPQNRGYVNGGLSIQVGFDETGHAERFVIAKAVAATGQGRSEHGRTKGFAQCFQRWRHMGLIFP